jgi:hypothetical protein
MGMQFKSYFIFCHPRLTLHLKLFRPLLLIIDPSSEIVPEFGPQRSARVSRPDQYGFFHTFFNATLSSISIPTCFSVAVKHECWRKAMDEELRALQDNHTWDVVPCPSNVKAIGCK